MDITINNLIISCHRSLLGAIPHNLRGLTVMFENETLHWIGYFDGEPSEEEKRLLTLACTEVIADFPIIKGVNEEYLNHSYPLKMDMLEFWAFLRWEKG
ncbi:hypothetical protein [Fictibacillus sp. BK138]|uniref:hypothetical protein n=1 Tax=Fictibacillus sp. BK138 TaxID=2512121 RepID=UPI00102A96FC|nr:hypothetical protein [Fictibacillus sp. BK138]RZT21624.1 hypothetical protein EV282_0687 [Fictibacillus sp. BK138]